MTFDDLQAMYRDFLFAVPYNSCSQLYEYFGGIEPDPRFGATCAFQALHLADRLEGAGASDVALHRDNRHVAVTCVAEGRRYLLDPYLLHRDPLDMEAATLKGSTSSPAYPVRLDDRHQERASRLELQSHRSGEAITLKYSRYSPSTGRYALARYFQLRPAIRETTLPPVDTIKALLFHPEQNNLSIRVLDRKREHVTDLIYPLYYYRGNPVRAEHLIVQTNTGEIVVPGTLSYDVKLKRMADALGTSTAEVEDFVLGAARLYEQHAPAGVQLHPYTAYDPKLETAV